MERSARLGENATKSFLKVPKIQSSPGTPSGRNTNSKPNLVTQTDDRPSLRHTNLGSTGKSGLLPWPHPTTTRGHCILFGNFCIMIPAPCHSWQTIRSRMRHLITFGRDFIVINSLRSVRKRGGNANQLVNGCPHSRGTVPSFVVCSKRWIGWSETSIVTNFVSTNRSHVEACPGCQCKFSGADR